MQRRLIKFERTITLADRLQDDIVRRGLTVGDSYYTTVEAAAFLGVSGASANRALQLLEKRGVLCRSQKKGAVLRDPTVKKAVLDHVHFILTEDRETPDFFGEEVVQGVRDEMPFSHIEFAKADALSIGDMVNEVVQRVRQGEQTRGFVMIAPSPEVHRSVVRSYLPSAALGTSAPGMPPVASLDVDRAECAQRLAECLRERNCHNIGFVLRSRMLPGDDDTIDAAVRQGIRSFHFVQHRDDDPELVAELAELASRHPELDGLICSSVRHADALCEALRHTGRNRKRPEVAVLFHYSHDERMPYPCLVPQKGARGLGRQLARLLCESAVGLPPKSEWVPLTLLNAAAPSRSVNV